jgi:lipopolysaccharide transport system ATP-binding protein
MPPAIRVDNLSKKYQLGEQAPAYRTLRESLTGAATGVWNGLKRVCARLVGNGHAEAVEGQGEFWALKDVSFEVQPGEVVGIIGRNGAGKSTLLKILSRITEPTSGRAEVRGRMGSLLEVGTGFHQELTGRENIYLNGSILGMSRGEITRKFDEIVSFAEVEQFLDTPVKRYSSGMYVRLAFAVAAHMQPEILVVDEVLAVGDSQFQKKCLGKMNEVGQSGRTVLFVSHNIAAIKALCTKGIVLRSGRMADIGPVETVMSTYGADGLGSSTSGFNRRRRLERSTECEILDASISRSGQRLDMIEWNQPFVINLDIAVFSRVRLSPEFIIRDKDQNPILFAPTGLFQGFQKTLESGRYRVTSHCSGLQLAAGAYYIDVMIGDPGIRFYDYYECALCFSVDDVPRPPHGWRFSQKRGQGSLPLALETRIIQHA